jgi:hypothetical protein
MPQAKFTGEASVDLLLEGLEMMFRLRIDNKEEVIELWDGRSEKVMTLRRQ